jgi:allantoicase
MTELDFTNLPDLASRTLGGSVLAANDDAFAERENLLNPWPAGFSDSSYGPKGKVYDGWETRRRRGSGHDWAIVRLGAPGIVHGVVIDTAWFKGNYPPSASVEAASFEGYPAPTEFDDAEWETIVPRSEIVGDSANRFEVDSERRYTHVRLSIYPDGGVARLRVHGDVIPDPRLLPASVDFATMQNGGTVTGCSDSFYTSPSNLILPDRARTTGEGWENARRRDEGNDFVEFRLGAPAKLTHAELDTSCFIHNAPGAAQLTGRDELTDEWVPLLTMSPMCADTRQVFRLESDRVVSHVRMDVFP